MKRYKSLFIYGICCVAHSLFLFPSQVKGYDFSQDSGIKETAEGTGHADAGLFTPGNLAGGIGTIISAILSFLGVIFLLLIIYGGYLWMTAAGNKEQTGKAQKIMTSAIVGLIIVVAAYAITAMLGSYLATV
jgi:cbb3-type cytochrome oxidase subunit 3